MAWDEWEQLKSEAAERSTDMRLNQLPADGGGGGGDLVAHQDDLGAVGHEAFVLYDGLHTGADIAAAGDGQGSDGSTMQAAATLKSHGFATGSALESTVEMWTSHLKSALQACAHISNHLDYSKKLHSQDDSHIAAVIKGRDGSAMSVSQLNEYFK
ncbi:hypothetical protein ACIRU3_22605 [Streptomyces sp. NPDC101151]|uniref:hypothetical protein n=1 Tax=Streptomyces sp. NPDC101151 TaxID=3366115 RepID=UPI00381BFED4